MDPKYKGEGSIEHATQISRLEKRVVSDSCQPLKLEIQGQHLAERASRWHKSGSGEFSV